VPSFGVVTGTVVGTYVTLYIPQPPPDIVIDNTMKWIGKVDEVKPGNPPSDTAISNEGQTPDEVA